MATKLYDITVKTGEYTNQQGETKGRYENIGTMMQGDNGPFIILKRTFNPAGVPNPENKDSVICSCFAPDNQQQGNHGQQHSQAPHQQYNQSPPQGYQGQQPPQQQGYINHQQGQQYNNNQGGYQGK